MGPTGKPGAPTQALNLPVYKMPSKSHDPQARKQHLWGAQLYLLFQALSSASLDPDADLNRGLAMCECDLYW
jgi:hypothetical protein